MNREFFKSRKNIIKGAAVLCVLAAVGFSIKPVKTMIDNSNALSDEQYTRLSKGKCINTIEVKGKVETLDDDLSVYSDSNNQQLKVIKVNCEVGDNVKKGDVIAELDSSELKKQIEQKKEALKEGNANSASNVKLKQDAYESLSYKYNNNLISAINENDKNVHQAEIDLNEKKRTYEQNQTLSQSGGISNEEVLKSKEALDKAQNLYDNSKLALDAAWNDAENELQKAQDEYESAKTASVDKSGEKAIEIEEDRLKNCEIKAPMDGTITEVNVTEGKPCGSNALFKIENLNDLIIKADVKENDITKVELNQKAEIKTDSLGDEEVEGYVYDIYPMAKAEDSDPFSLKSDDDDDESEFVVKIKLNDYNEKILNGMNAIVDIVLEEKDDVYTVPCNCIVKEGNDDYIYAAIEKENNYEVEKIKVSKGTESDTKVEIYGDEVKDNIIVLNTPSDYDVGKALNIK